MIYRTTYYCSECPILPHYVSYMPKLTLSSSVFLFTASSSHLALKALICVMLPSYQEHAISIPPENQLQFGLQWDFFQGMDPVDLDVQVFLFYSFF